MYEKDTDPDYRSCKFGTEEDSKFGFETFAIYQHIQSKVCNYSTFYVSTSAETLIGNFPSFTKFIFGAITSLYLLLLNFKKILMYFQNTSMRIQDASVSIMSAANSKIKKCSSRMP